MRSCGARSGARERRGRREPILLAVLAAWLGAGAEHDSRPKALAQDLGAAVVAAIPRGDRGRARRRDQGLGAQAEGEADVTEKTRACELMDDCPTDTDWWRDLDHWERHGPGDPEFLRFLDHVRRLTRLEWALSEILCEDHDGWAEDCDMDEGGEALWPQHLWFYAPPDEAE